MGAGDTNEVIDSLRGHLATRGPGSVLLGRADGHGKVLVSASLSAPSEDDDDGSGNEISAPQAHVGDEGLGDGVVGVVASQLSHLVPKIAAAAANTNGATNLVSKVGEEVGREAIISSIAAALSKDFATVAATLVTCMPNVRAGLVALAVREDEEGPPKSLKSSSRYTAPTVGTGSSVESDRDVGTLYKELKEKAGIDHREVLDHKRQYYWTEEYHRLQTQLKAKPGDLETLVRLSNHSKSFTSTASLYARVIAAEYALPNSERVIKPITAGGLAGGEKYLCAGVFFKRATDAAGIYGSDELASKAARHDLRGINLLSQTATQHDIHVPLACAVDFNGVTILAVALLPEGQLVYGSADGGRTVHDGSADAAVASAMSNIGQALNLRAHTVGACQMHLCGDIEVRRCADGDESNAKPIYYALDCARIMPCEPPAVAGGTHSLCSPLPNGDDSTVSASYALRHSGGGGGAFLVRLLRPELVMSHHEALCSDAFSGWDDSAAELVQEHNEDVDRCFQRMINESISNVVSSLALSTPEEVNNVQISHTLHLHGVNVRFLKQVTAVMQQRHPNHPWVAALITEMAARACKTVIRKILALHTVRTKGLAIGESYGSLVRAYLGRILLDQREEDWAELMQVIDDKFYLGPRCSNLLENVDMTVLFDRVCEMIGASSSASPILMSTHQGANAASLHLRLAQLVITGGKIHDMEIVTVSRVLQAVHTAKQEANEIRELALLHPIQEVSQWSMPVLKTYGGDLPRSLLRLAELLAKYSGTSSFVRPFTEAIVLFDAIHGQRPELKPVSDAERNRVMLHKKWRDEVMKVGARIEQEILFRFGSSPSHRAFAPKLETIHTELRQLRLLLDEDSGIGDDTHEEAVTNALIHVRAMISEDLTDFYSNFPDLDEKYYDMIVNGKHDAAVKGVMQTVMFYVLSNHRPTHYEGCPPNLMEEARRVTDRTFKDIGNPIYGMVGGGVTGSGWMAVYYLEEGKLLPAEDLMLRGAPAVFENSICLDDATRLVTKLSSQHFVSVGYFINMILLRTGSFAAGANMLHAIDEAVHTGGLRHPSFHCIHKMSMLVYRFRTLRSDITAKAVRDWGLNGLARFHAGLGHVLMAWAEVELYMRETTTLDTVLGLLDREFALSRCHIFATEITAIRHLKNAIIASKEGASDVSKALFDSLKQCLSDAEAKARPLCALRIAVLTAKEALHQQLMLGTDVVSWWVEQGSRILEDICLHPGNQGNSMLGPRVLKYSALAEQVAEHKHQLSELQTNPDMS